MDATAAEQIARIDAVDTPCRLPDQLLPALPPSALGDPDFRARQGLRYAAMTGAMANGIASAELVIAAGQAGLLGSYGAAGQAVATIDAAISTIRSGLGEHTFAVNLIHSPNEPAHEEKVVELLLARRVELVEASAYLDLTPAVVRWRVVGLRDEGGRVVAGHRLIAKASRVEVARRWLAPAPSAMLDRLLADGRISTAQRALAGRVPMCDALSAEADSGGHTDNRPAICLLPTFLALRDRMQAELGLETPVPVGLGGGIATPQGAAAAYAMGAAYILTGSINQACVESGTSATVRAMLAAAEQADVIMAPAADMFELGVKLQVLKRGTMFAMRAQKLHDWWKQHGDVDALPAADRQQLEQQILRRPVAEVWAECERFWSEREPQTLERARQDPRRRLALICRWYLGLASRWAKTGEAGRQMDFQIWCGPAMGAFNEWARGSALEAPAARQVGVVNRQLLLGAARVLRRQAAQQAGFRPGAWPSIRPAEAAELHRFCP